jgi:hypothetical protein
MYILYFHFVQPIRLETFLNGTKKRAETKSSSCIVVLRQCSGQYCPTGSAPAGYALPGSWAYFGSKFKETVLKCSNQVSPLTRCESQLHSVSVNFKTYKLRLSNVLLRYMGYSHGIGIFSSLLQHEQRALLIQASLMQTKESIDVIIRLMGVRSALYCIPFQRPCAFYLFRQRLEKQHHYIGNH